MNYKPKPADLSAVRLPDEIGGLVESLARNVHEVWAQGRIDDGWKYGELRDDAKKTHPCIVPYEDLTEKERDFDRRTALSTIKFIMSLGYKISK
ncbi:MAG: RyR domain-containing protein [Muribaculaceae bacterium]|jgi:hypothetical protein|nr:RyR domain-containing protein [Muribaculaceae bacterium]